MAKKKSRSSYSHAPVKETVMSKYSHNPGSHGKKKGKKKGY